MCKLWVYVVDMDCWRGSWSKQTNRLARLTCDCSLTGLACLLDIEKKKSQTPAHPAQQPSKNKNKNRKKQNKSEAHASKPIIGQHFRDCPGSPYMAIPSASLTPTPLLCNPTLWVMLWPNHELHSSCSGLPNFLEIFGRFYLFLNYLYIL